MSGEVIYEYYDEGYSVIRLHRPHKRNAISEQMIEQFSSCLKKAKQANIKFLVITGSGNKLFSAGGDLNYFHGNLLASEAFSRLYSMKEVLFDIASFPVPTICLLNGGALGGGCEIATACDFRITKESAEFGFVQSKLGIIPGWGGGVLLYEKVHPNFAYHWLMNAKIYHAPYLLEQGWLHKVVKDEDWNNSEDLLAPYKNKSYEQMTILKKQFNNKLSILALSAQMNEEVRSCSTLWETEEHQQAVNHFLAGK